MDSTTSQPIPTPTTPYIGIRKRGSAYIIDSLFIIIPILILAFLKFDEGAVELISAILFLVYCTAMEYRTGQTLGKKAEGIKVVMTDGRTCTLRAAIIRNAARIIDLALLGYVIGIIAIMVTKKKQRIGDILAGTVVVPA